MIGRLGMCEILIGLALIAWILVGCDTWGYLAKFIAFVGQDDVCVRLDGKAVRSNTRMILALKSNVGLQAEGIKTIDCHGGGCFEACRDGSPAGASLRVPPRSLRENREIWPCSRLEVQAARRHLPGAAPFCPSRVARLVSRRSVGVTCKTFLVNLEDNGTSSGVSLYTLTT